MGLRHHLHKNSGGMVVSDNCNLRDRKVTGWAFSEAANAVDTVISDFKMVQKAWSIIQKILTLA